MINRVMNLIKTSIIRIFYKKNIDYSVWVFSSSFNTEFNYNSKYLFEYALNNEKNITPIYVINDDEKRKKLQCKYGEKHIVETKSIGGIKRVLNAGVWFTSAGLPVYGLKLGVSRIIINLWHGVPLKKIALMENNLNSITRLYFKNIFSNNYTYILTTSKNLVDIMAKSFGVSKDKIKVWGQPRNDAIFKSNNREEVLDLIYQDLPTYKKILLYAPTYRDEAETILFPFKDYNIEGLNDFLKKNGIIIFIRSHQSETISNNNYYGDRIRSINSDKVDEIMDIINIFDLLITDYSSIYIDYLLTEKPIIFLPYDKEDYLEQRGLNFDYDTVTPGPKPVTLNDFKREALKLLNEDDYYSIERKQVNLLFNDVSGTSSQTICENVKNGIKHEFL